MNIIEGDSLLMNAVIFNDRNTANRDYLASRMNDVMLDPNVSGHTRAFFTSSQQLMEQYNSDESRRLLDLSLRTANLLFGQNEVQALTSLLALQTAPTVMMKYVMAEPTVRNQYHKGLCDGYSDTYIDVEPGLVGEDHYDYRRVMDGIVECTDDTYTCSVWIEDLRHQDDELLFAQQCDILSTWDTLKGIMAKRLADPTSVWGGDLG